MKTSKYFVFSKTVLHNHGQYVPLRPKAGLSMGSYPPPLSHKCIYSFDGP